MSQFVFVFPGGKKTIQKDTGIAGNVATTMTVPARKMWLLLNASIELTTDGNVGNRHIDIRTRDAADAEKFMNYTSDIPESSTQVRFFTQNVGGVGTVINALGLQILTAGEDVNLAISSGLAGDSYDYLLEYLEIDAP